MTRYFCDNCGAELFEPKTLNGAESNFDGWMSYNPMTNKFLALCNECRKKLTDEIMKNYMNETKE